MSDIFSKVKILREQMALNKIDAWIITGTDPHQSEYLAPSWNDRFWLSGFSGSAGNVVVTQEFAGLWTDSRYYIQAEKELEGGPFVMVKQDVKTPNAFLLWCKNNLVPGSTIATDGFDLSISQHFLFQKTLGNDFVIKTDLDLIHRVWENRPLLPKSPVFVLDTAYCGQSTSEKLAEIQTFIKENNTNFYLISALDEVAWLLNLRGSDVAFNPVFICYLIVGTNEVFLFTDESRLSKEAKVLLDENKVYLKPYDSIIEFLNGLPEETTLAYDPSLTSVNLSKATNAKRRELLSPVPMKKAMKNGTEIVNTKNAMVKDGIALAKAFYWLQDSLKKDSITEYEFAQQLSHQRSLMPGYIGDSFYPIVGYLENGAVVHYHPKADSSKQIHNTGVLLVDSGGQYLEGTTDITRTISLGNASKEAQKAFTLVLKGMIALSRAVFPVGTSGLHLDILARQFLWEQGLNYGHGTGHGVGFCLNVHEGPQSIAGIYNHKTKTSFLPGMITSNEPGFYLPGEFGVRIENLILAINHPAFADFIKFETITYFPIDIAMIDETRMDSSEKAWFNSYHQKVKSLILPHLEEPVKTWFELKCRPLN